MQRQKANWAYVTPPPILIFKCFTKLQTFKYAKDRQQKKKKENTSC